MIRYFPSEDVTSIPRPKILILKDMIALSWVLDYGEIDIGSSLLATLTEYE